MISLTVIPESTKMTIEVPAEYVNKKLHVEIREEGRSEGSLPTPDAASYAEVAEFYSHLRKDLEGMCFDRDEAHER